MKYILFEVMRRSFYRFPNYIYGACAGPFKYSYNGKSFEWTTPGNFLINLPKNATQFAVNSGASNITKIYFHTNLSFWFRTNNPLNDLGVTHITLPKSYDYFQFYGIALPNGMFRGCTKLETIENLNYIKNMHSSHWAFGSCVKLKSLDLHTVTSLSNAMYVFAYCESLESIDLSGLTSIGLTGQSTGNEFTGCVSLKHIKCRRNVRDLILANADRCNLPTAMREGGSGTWELID